MEKPINFLTARGATMLEVAGVARSMTQMLEYVRDQTLAAAEAKVRGECADTLRDMESASHGYRRSSEEWQRRAERAEAERDIWRDNAMHEKAHAERTKTQLAEYKRVAAYEALTKLADKFVVDWGLKKVNTIRKFRDSLYAPTPARSVLPVVNVSDFYDAPAVIIRPEQALAAPPQERVSEAITLPTDDEAWDLYRGIRRMFPDEQEAITRFARALTAALAPSRRAPSGDGGGV